ARQMHRSVVRGQTESKQRNRPARMCVVCVIYHSANWLHYTLCLVNQVFHQVSIVVRLLIGLLAACRGFSEPVFCTSASRACPAQSRSHWQWPHSVQVTMCSPTDPFCSIQSCVLSNV